MIKTLLAVTLAMTLALGCSQKKTCGVDCTKPCCVEAKGQCPPDCDKPCCADKKAKCPADCDKPCCADKKAAE